MRKLLTWLLVTLGVAALVRRLRRRGQAADSASESSAGEDPADELRRKLEAARSEEPAQATAASTEGTVEERRADVHEEGRAALHEMRSSGDDD